MISMKNMDELPRPKIWVEWQDGYFFIRDKRCMLFGITKAIANLFVGWRRGRSIVSTPNITIDKLEARNYGTKVDTEMKNIANEICLPDYKNLCQETKSIVNYLQENDIKLIEGGVLVTNFEDDAYRSGVKKFSFTEVDLVGLKDDRVVVIELKLTTKKISDLLDENTKARKNKITGFTNSTLGRYFAQLGCTTLMFYNTYPNVICFPLLIICEIGTGRCAQIALKREQYTSNTFRLLPGFTV